MNMDAVPTIFTVAKVTAETEQMHLLSLKTEKPWTFIPGQVAVLGIEGVGESYFAVASAPEDKNSMEVLVKDGKGASAALFRVTEGAKVQGKGPTGKGFPVDNYTGRDFLIAAVGSAISPMRSVIRHICAKRGQFGKVTLIFGMRFPAEFPFLKEVKEWEKAGINVILTVSKPEGTNWTGKTGHVEVHFAETLKKLNKPVALICGMKAMQEESKVELAKLGIAPTEILTNY
jgi:sulfhydrogenase subunit gamma (sulfur reductase)